MIKKLLALVGIAACIVVLTASTTINGDRIVHDLTVTGTCTGCAAGVTSIATTSPITGGTITTTGTIACATCVVASSPGVGLAHFAGSTQTVTSSAVNLAGADVTGLLGNGNYYGVLKSQRISTAESTASGTYVALTTPETITFTLAATTTVVATYTSQCSINFVTSETFNIILVDGSQVATTEQLTDITSANFNQVCNATYSGSLASGSHTIAVQHKMFVATTTTGTWSNRLLMAYASP